MYTCLYYCKRSDPQVQSSYAHFNRKASLKELNSKDLQMKAIETLLFSFRIIFWKFKYKLRKSTFRRQSDFFGDYVEVFRLEHDLRNLEAKLLILKANFSNFDIFDGQIANRKARRRSVISGIDSKDIKLHNDVKCFVSSYYKKDIDLYKSVGKK